MTKQDHLILEKIISDIEKELSARGLRHFFLSHPAELLDQPGVYEISLLCNERRKGPKDFYDSIIVAASVFFKEDELTEENMKNKMFAATVKYLLDKNEKIFL